MTDVIGDSFDNTLVGTSGDDVIYTGGGKDTVSAGDGNDTIVINGAVTGGSSFDGGAGTDTLLVTMAAASAPTAPGDTYYSVGFLGSTLTGIENFQIASQAGEQLRATIFNFQVGSVGTVVGGAGADQLQILVLPGGASTTYVMPALPTQNWGSEDSVSIVGIPPQLGQTASNYTLDSSAYGGKVLLVGQGGNDNLTAGAGNDVLFAQDGNDTLNGGAGDDFLIGGAGNDHIDGGIGQDIAVFSGNYTDYTISEPSTGVIRVTSNANPANVTDVTNVETFRFADIDKHPVGTGGQIIDGYIAGATVYVDVNNNGAWDIGEPTTTTDSQGNFTFNTFLTGPIRAFGGVNIDTNLPNTLDLSAPEGSTVITPITTLIQTLVEAGETTAAAETKVAAALGIDPSLDLTHTDLLQAASSGSSAALEAQQAAAIIATVLTAVESNGGSVETALQTMADTAGTGGSLDLTDSQTLTTIVAESVPNATPEQLNQIVTTTAATTTAIDNSTTVSGISDVQDNHPPAATPDQFSVSEDATRTGNVLANDSTGETDPNATDHLIVTAVSGNAVGSGTTTVQGLYGTLAIGADGSFSYKADADVLDALPSGQHLTETFSYDINDGKGGIASSTLSFDVSTINDLVTLTAAKGNSSLTGTSADEIINGGEGNNSLSGLGGSDRMYGGAGNDVLHGGDGWDLLVGGTGNDTLYGDAGNDVIAGGKGNDNLFGGAGADVFDFGAGTGNDVIRDFELGVDHIHLSDGVTVTSVKATLGGTTLFLSDGGNVQLAGINGLGDYHSLLVHDLPSWSVGLVIV